tara:strand:- start:676 stop:1245 length:570 start_codon:yes stop_codon:yes gene_type:complete
MFYIYYDLEYGTILQCTNELSPENTNSYIEVDQETYVKFVSGEFSISDHRILLDKVNGEFNLIRSEELGVDIARSIHEFPKTKTKLMKDNIFYIIQNQKKKEWQARAKLTGVYTKFLTHVMQLNKIKKIYVTEENNPNVLLDVLEVPMERFFNNKIFTIKKSNNKTISRKDISLYSYVKHEEYYHRTIE